MVSVSFLGLTARLRALRLVKELCDNADFAPKTPSGGPPDLWICARDAAFLAEILRLSDALRGLFDLASSVLAKTDQVSSNNKAGGAAINNFFLQYEWCLIDFELLDFDDVYVAYRRDGWVNMTQLALALPHVELNEDGVRISIIAGRFFGEEEQGTYIPIRAAIELCGEYGLNALRESSILC